MSNLRTPTSVPALVDSVLSALSNVPACQIMACEWLGQMAIAFATQTAIDDTVFGKKGQEMRDEKMGYLTRTLALAMEHGYTDEKAMTEAKKTVEKMVSAEFEKKSVSEETLELLLASGMSEAEVQAEVESDNMRDQALVDARKRNASEHGEEIKHRIYRMVSHAKSESIAGDARFLTDTPLWFGRLVVNKIESACSMHRGYLVRQVRRGKHGFTGQLTVLNKDVMDVCKFKAVLNELDLIESSEGEYDEGRGFFETGRRAGEDERPDITY